MSDNAIDAKVSIKPSTFLNPVPVVMATCGDMENSNIITLAWAGTINSEPPMLSISIRKERFSHDIIQNNGVFGVNLVSKSLIKACDYCGVKSGRDVDKFEGFEDAKRSENGLLYVAKNANAFLSGEVFQTVDLGTHTMFIANVTEMDVLSETPSLTYAYYHANVKPKPEAAKKSGYRCKICGYVYEGEPLPEDFICPWCKHGAEDFEKIEI